MATALDPKGARQEMDSLGAVEVESSAYWGAQTQRAVDNFTYHGSTMPLAFTRALCLIQKNCAKANVKLGFDCARYRTCHCRSA